MSTTPEELRPDCHATPFLVTAQLVTLVVLHEMVVEPPLATRAGFATKLVISGESTVTEVPAEANLPPAPVQVIWKLDGFVVSADD